MIIIKEGDLFRAPSGIICHQVNCKGVMGRGVAKTFKEKYPFAFSQYKDLCKDRVPDELLGTVLMRYEIDNKWTCCMFAQDDWRGHGCNTDYAAFEECCDAIKREIKTLYLGNITINMPYGIGAGLGGGNWDTIYSILKNEFKNYNVILWKLN